MVPRGALAVRSGARHVPRGALAVRSGARHVPTWGRWLSAVGRGMSHVGRWLVNGHPIFPPVGQLKIPPWRWLLWCETERGCFVSASGSLFPVAGAVGAVGNADGFMSAFSKSCGKARPHRGFP